jgi:hypothetical protein
MGSLTSRKIVRHGTSGFTSCPKEGVLRILIALKKAIASAGFEPATLGSSGKHTNYYTTEATNEGLQPSYSCGVRTALIKKQVISALGRQICIQESTGSSHKRQIRCNQN